MNLLFFIWFTCRDMKLHQVKANSNLGILDKRCFWEVMWIHCAYLMDSCLALSVIQICQPSRDSLQSKRRGMRYSKDPKTTWIGNHLDLSLPGKLCHLDEDKRDVCYLLDVKLFLKGKWLDGQFSFNAWPLPLSLPYNRGSNTTSVQYFCILQTPIRAWQDKKVALSQVYTRRGQATLPLSDLSSFWFHWAIASEYAWNTAWSSSASFLIPAFFSSWLKLSLLLSNALFALSTKSYASHTMSFPIHKLMLLEHHEALSNLKVYTIQQHLVECPPECFPCLFHTSSKRHSSSLK